MLKTPEKQQAEHHHREGNLAEAENFYALHLANHPHDHEVHHALGILFARLKQLPSALRSIEKAISLNAHQATYHNSLGNVLRQLSELEVAAKAYKKAIKLSPTYATAYNNLGNVFLLQKKLIAAKQAYEKAIALKENYTDAYTNLMLLGNHFLYDEQYLEARDVFLKCIDKMPENTDLNHHLGIAYFKSHDFDQAKIQFEKVLILNYKHPEVNQYFANTLLECHEHEKAITYYFRQLEYNPLYETYYNLGVLFMMKDRMRDALLYFNKAIEMQPDDIATQLNLGNIYLKQNRLDNAIACYEKANQLKPNDAEIRHILSALKQEHTPDHAPVDYVTHLFDQYAPYYDHHLIEALKYDTPQKMVDALLLECPYFSNTKHTILDLGCGTGLCGALFKPFANELIGIDLSENMLSVAKQKNIYDNLDQADASQALTQYDNADLILAADVFTYCGDLDATFKNAQTALKSNGLFIFTVEKTYQEPFILQTSIRYAHSKNYLELLINKYHFEVIRIDNLILRKQKNEPVEGYLVFLKKP